MRPRKTEMHVVLYFCHTPQDLRFFWKALAEIGISEQLAMPQVSSDREMRLIVDRSMSIINTLS